MALFSSTQPSLRARILPRFPAQVLAGSGMSITKANGIYTFSADLTNIPVTSLADITSDRLIGRDSAGDGPPEQLTVGGGLGFTGSGGLQMTPNQRIRVLSIPMTSLGASAKYDYYVPFSCTIAGATILADTSGNLVLDVWKDVFANYPPTVADTITASAKPTLSSAASYRDTTLSGWTVDIAAGDTLRVNVDSVSGGIQNALLALDVVVT